ncbi:unnamed protein product [Brassicogethes aeneus]|uniref:Helitron helicase-like domain-containing protein n=1 Tax=Brassicogethes aeneus TaxID=1431903 RepID=A0A9P0AQQ6_BRAAE|nr:unnamed protein product [Brassicogethes aeneus]
MGIINQNTKAETIADWINEIRGARANPAPFKVFDLEQSFFRQWNKYLAPYYVVKCPFAIQPLREIQAEYEHPKYMTYRSSYNGAFETAIVRTASINQTEMIGPEKFFLPDKKYTEPIKISLEKWENLQQLKTFCETDGASEFYDGKTLTYEDLKINLEKENIINKPTEKPSPSTTQNKTAGSEEGEESSESDIETVKESDAGKKDVIEDKLKTDKNKKQPSPPQKQNQEKILRKTNNTPFSLLFYISVFKEHPLIHHFYRVEFQQRGSPHLHMMVWNYGAPTVEKRAACDFIDKFVMCDSELPGLEGLIAMQKHNHSKSCKNAGLTKETYMRMIELSLRKPAVMLKRRPKDCFVNNFNMDILCLQRSNMDIQFILNLCACVSHIVSFMKKSRLQGPGSDHKRNKAKQH